MNEGHVAESRPRSRDKSTTEWRRARRGSDGLGGAPLPAGLRSGPGVVDAHAPLRPGVVGNVARNEGREETRMSVRAARDQAPTPFSDEGHRYRRQDRVAADGPLLAGRRVRGLRPWARQSPGLPPCGQGGGRTASQAVLT